MRAPTELDRGVRRKFIADRDRAIMVAHLLDQSFVDAVESFGVAAAGFVMLLAALLIAGIWETVLQQMKLNKIEREHRRKAKASQALIKLDLSPPAQPTARIPQIGHTLSQAADTR